VLYGVRALNDRSELSKLDKRLEDRRGNDVERVGGRRNPEEKSGLEARLSK
jgi:hypothetical protein